MTFLYIFLIIIAHIIWHYAYIKINKGMSANYKAITIILTWAIILLLGYCEYKMRFIFAIPFLICISSLFKNMILGYFLHGDIFYLGPGKYDRFVSRMFQGGKGYSILINFCILIFQGLLRYLRKND